MNRQWQEFLAREGAVIQNGIVTDFGNPAEERNTVGRDNVIASLSHEGLIGVTGPDAAKFLQGQLTCNLNEVAPNASRLGAWCSAKGRVRITFRLFQWDGGFYLALPLECLDYAITQLQKYILRSKVSLRDASDERLRLGCAGPSIEEGLREIFKALPQAPDQVVQEGATTIIRLSDSASPCFEVVGTIDTLSAVWNTLRARATAVGREAWTALHILAGVPVITPPLTEAFVPHMLNLPEIGAVSFQKGCYTGQEIVARTQYLGKSKRHLHLAWIPAGEPPKAGDALWIAAETEHPGQIVNSAPAPEGGFLVLAVVASADVKKGGVRLRDQAGAELAFRALPYPIASE